MVNTFVKIKTLHILGIVFLYACNYFISMTQSNNILSVRPVSVFTTDVHRSKLNRRYVSWKPINQYLLWSSVFIYCSKYAFCLSFIVWGNVACSGLLHRERSIKNFIHQIIVRSDSDWFTATKLRFTHNWSIKIRSSQSWQITSK